MEMSLSNLVWTSGVLAAVLAAVLVGAGLLRRVGLGAAGRSGRRLQLVEALAIDQRRRLVIARCDGRDILLLTGGVTDGAVGWLPADAPSPGPHLPGGAG